MIKVFLPTETDYSSNGEILVKPLKATVVNSKNGNYYVDLEVDLSYQDYVVPNNIIVVDTPTGEQPFRIRTVDYTHTRIKARCWHIYYDSEQYLMINCQLHDLSVADALAAMLSSANAPFSVGSSIPTTTRITKVFEHSSLMDGIEEIAKDVDGVLYRNGWEIYIDPANAGVDSGVSIRYAKNLKNIEVEYDWGDVCTKLFPIGDNNTQLPEMYLISPITYPIPYTRSVTFSQSTTVPKNNYYNSDNSFNETAYLNDLIADLRSQGTRYLNEHSIPSVNYTVDVYAPDRVLDIGSIVDVKDELINVNVTASVIAYQYNSIRKMFDEIELGNYKKSIESFVQALRGQAVTASQKIEEVQKDSGSAIVTTQQLYYLRYQIDPVSPGSTWITSNSTEPDGWTTYVPTPKSNCHYYSCVQMKTANGSVITSAIRRQNDTSLILQWCTGTTDTQFDGRYIYTGSIYADSIAANAIETRHIKANAVTADQIAAGVITASKIATHTLNATQVDNFTIIDSNNNIIFSANSSNPAVQIAGFTVDNNSIYSGRSFSEALQSGVVMCRGSTTSINIGNSGNISGWSFTAGGKFGVTSGGAMYASDFHLKQSSTSDSHSFAFDIKPIASVGDAAILLNVDNDVVFRVLGTGEVFSLYYAVSNSLSAGNITPYGGNLTGSIGDSTHKWQHIYCDTLHYNTLDGGGGSDERIKQHMRPVDQTYELIFDELKPILFDYKKQDLGKTHIGFGAQTVEKTLNKYGIDISEFAGVYKSWVTENDDKIERYYVKYDEFIALCVDQIQKLKKRVKLLEGENDKRTSIDI